MVGESGPRMSTMVGESGELPLGMSTIVGESAEGTGVLDPGISIRVGESEGGAVPGEELSPLDGVRSAAPPSPGSEGFPSGRPRENSSIRISGNDIGPCRGTEAPKGNPGLAHTSPKRGTSGGNGPRVNQYITEFHQCQPVVTGK